MNQYMKKFSVASSLVLYKDIFCLFQDFRKIAIPADNYIVAEYDFLCRKHKQLFAQAIKFLLT